LSDQLSRAFVSDVVGRRAELLTRHGAPIE